MAENEERYTVCVGHPENNGQLGLLVCAIENLAGMFMDHRKLNRAMASKALRIVADSLEHE